MATKTKPKTKKPSVKELEARAKELSETVTALLIQVDDEQARASNLELDVDDLEDELADAKEELASAKFTSIVATVLVVVLVGLSLL